MKQVVLAYVGDGTPEGEWARRMSDAAGDGDVAALADAIADAPAGCSLDTYLDGIRFGCATALMISCWQGQRAAAELLIAAGADPLLRDITGRCPLNYATSNLGILSKEEETLGRTLAASVAPGADLPAQYRLDFQVGLIAERPDGPHTNLTKEKAAFRELVDKEFRRTLRLTLRWDEDYRGALGGMFWLLPEEVKVARRAAEVAIRKAKARPGGRYELGITTLEKLIRERAEREGAGTA